MAGSRKPRRVPSKGELAMRSPVWLASKKAPVTKKLWTELVRVARMAFHRITTGDARPDDPDELATVVNLGMLLCEPEWSVAGSEEYLPIAQAARDALGRAADREARGLPFSLDEEGLEPWREMLELHEALLEAAGQDAIMRALLEVDRRIRIGAVIRKPGNRG